jgi:hypothetical protein
VSRVEEESPPHIGKKDQTGSALPFVRRRAVSASEG